MSAAPGRTVSGNVLANFTTRIWAALLQLVFTPVYIALLGPEAYGLIGFYTMLVVALGFLDHAVSPALMREFARLSLREDGSGEMRDLLRTLEVLTSLVGVTIGAAVFLFAPIIATTWLKYRTLDPTTVVWAVRLMGVGLACQWPSLLYSGGYVGLGRQAVLAALRIVGLTVQWAGAALALWTAGARVELFFAWQIFGYALLSAMLGVRLWRLLPASQSRARFEIRTVRRVARYSLGTLLIGLTASILAQADKLIVSSTVPLDQFAAYSLCFMIVTLIYGFIAAPTIAALLPHFTQLVVNGDEARLAFEYHRWTQVLMVPLLPACGVLLVFGKPLLELWLSSRPQLVEPMMPLLPWVVLGALFSVVTLFPYVLQLAAGWTRLSVLKNVVAVVVLLPVLVLGVPRLGPIVGAWCLFALNFGYYALEVPLVHRRLLRGEMRLWWLRDTLFPGALATAFFWVVAELVALAPGRPLASLAEAALTGISALVLLAIALPHPRAMVKEASRRLVKSWA